MDIPANVSTSSLSLKVAEQSSYSEWGEWIVSFCQVGGRNSAGDGDSVLQFALQGMAVVLGTAPAPRRRYVRLTRRSAPRRTAPHRTALHCTVCSPLSGSVIRRRSRWCHFLSRPCISPLISVSFIFAFDSFSVDLFPFLQILSSHCIGCVTKYQKRNKAFGVSASQVSSGASVTQSTYGHNGEIPQVCLRKTSSRLSEC